MLKPSKEFNFPKLKTKLKKKKRKKSHTVDVKG
jgi:hypothetical protein